jgi:hypothetical protein
VLVINFRQLLTNLFFPGKVTKAKGTALPKRLRQSSSSSILPAEKQDVVEALTPAGDKVKLTKEQLETLQKDSTGSGDEVAEDSEEENE